jgi:predicted Zn-dependent peptidase
VFSGSKKYPREKLSEILESRGSEFTFNASLERSIFSLSSLSEYFENDLDMVSDVIKNPEFSKDDLNLLRAQTLQGIKKRTENPASMAYIASHLILWKDNIRGLISTEKTISSIDRNHLLKWNSNMISAERMSMLITGDFEIQKVKKILNKVFGKYPKGKLIFDQNLLEVKNLTARKGNGIIYSQKKEIPQTTIVFSAPGIAHSDPDYYALKLYDYLLGGNSFNSYLTQIIRVKNGWAYSVYSTYQTSGFAGSISIFTQTQNQNVPDVVREIGEILKSPERFIDDQKLKEAKNSISNSFVFFGETPEKMAGLQLSLLWDNLDDSYLKNFLNNINRVTIEDLKRVSNKYYTPDNFFISIVGPDSVLNTLQNQLKIVPFNLPE